jgi:lysophospholipase L1-like esterase
MNAIFVAYAGNALACRLQVRIGIIPDTEFKRRRCETEDHMCNGSEKQIQHGSSLSKLRFWLLLLCFLPAACCVSRAAQPSPLPSLFILGDSTANIGGDAAVNAVQQLGWGTPFAAYFDPAKIHVVNAAKAGRSSRTFFTEGLWAHVELQLKPGDFVLIEFGHNDPGDLDGPKARGSLHGIGPETQEITHPDGTRETVHTFGWYLEQYIAGVRAKGALPIMLSVTPRNIWTDGHVERGLGHYREWARQVAEAEDVDFVDVSGIVADAYEKLGKTKVTAFFPLNHTHTSPAGAAFVARQVAAGLKALPDTPFTPYFSAIGEAVVSASQANLPLPSKLSLPTLWIIGDSTVRNGEGDGANGQWGWGDEIAPYFNTRKINVVNRAVGGRSSRTFYHFDWPADLAMIRKGDMVLMQFGHNDNGPLDDKARARGTLPGDGPETRTIDNPITRKHEVVHTYGWYLEAMIAQAKTKGAKAIVCSLIPRKVWNGDTIHRESYVPWAREAAQRQHAAFVSLNEIIAEQYEKLGKATTATFFGDPHTHTNLAGAKMNAASVIKGLKALKHDPLKKYLSAEAQGLPKWEPARTGHGA